MTAGRTFALTGVLCVAVLFLGPAKPAAQATFSSLEKEFEAFRRADDAVEIAKARGRNKTGGALEGKRDATRRSALQLLDGIEPGALSPGDGRALAVMKDGLHAGEDAAPAKQGDLEKLTAKTYEAYTRAAENIPFEGKTLDRLTVFELLSRTEDPDRRRRLFLSLAPVWQSVNGDDGESSPYRSLVRARVSAWAKGSEATPFEAKPKEFGLDRKTVESWLLEVLSKWRDITPDRELDPWDYAYTWGAADRALSPSIPHDSLRKTNEAYYRSIGADPRKLGLRFDLEPRKGKDPVASTTFGVRPHVERGGFVPGESWIFATYRVGGLGTLAELMHETGHGIHISAIRTRPAFLDWPDSDTFTEALADFPALEVYEPAWQKRYLGHSAPLADSIRSKYSGVVLDVAWALFEMRVHDDPAADPNGVWTEITHRYLRVKPHPELSWWAMRGQLVDSPAYLMNYAFGSILTADLRARTVVLRGGKPFTDGDPSLYPFLCERLYRFGLERPSRLVLEDYLGRPLSPRSLLEDMERGKQP